MAPLTSVFHEPVAEDPGAIRRLLSRLRRPVPLLRYLLAETETHATCGALAFFALLAFYPSCFLMLAITERMQTLGAPALVQATLREYYPEAQAFLLRNLAVSVARHGERVDTASVVWVFLGAAGVFVPLESALNRLWRFDAHRPYWRNQAVGFALTTACGLLAFGFVLVTSAATGLLRPGPVLAQVLLRGAAVALAACASFLFYRFLPNGAVAARDLWPAAALAGLVGETVRLVFVKVLPLLELQRTQGPYYVSISFALLVYVEAFVLLGGAFLARPDAPRPPALAAEALPTGAGQGETPADGVGRPAPAPAAA